jgi:hypothetical protein
MLNLNRIAHDSPAKTLMPQKDSSAFSIDVFTLQSSEREEVEAFIKQGFKKVYAANIEVTMPFLLAVNNGQWKAALGIRSASDELFVEQYLQGPVEQSSVLRDKNIERRQIAEIGHLYSNARKFTIPLFLVMAVSLFCLDFKYVVFSGTQRVIDIITQAGIDSTHLTKADPALLDSSADDWGSYYQTDPQVVLISLSSVMKVIEGQPVYKRLFKQLEKKVATVCKKLEVIK